MLLPWARAPCWGYCPQDASNPTGPGGASFSKACLHCILCACGRVALGSSPLQPSRHPGCEGEPSLGPGCPPCPGTSRTPAPRAWLRLPGSALIRDGMHMSRMGSVFADGTPSMQQHVVSSVGGTASWYRGRHCPVLGTSKHPTSHPWKGSDGLATVPWVAVHHRAPCGVERRLACVLAARGRGSIPYERSASPRLRHLVPLGWESAEWEGNVPSLPP